MSLLDQAKASRPAPMMAQGAMTPPSPSAGASPQAPTDAPDSQGTPMTPQSISAMQAAIMAKVAPQDQQAMSRIVLAGTKVLYDPKTSNMLMEEIKSNEPTDKKLAGGSAGLMALLNQESKGQIPPQVYIPAGSILLLDIAKTMIQGGEAVTDQDVRDGIDQMSAVIQAKHGVPPQAIAQNLGGQQASMPPPSGMAAPSMAPPGTMQGAM